MTNRRNLLILLTIGFLIREIFAPWTGHPWDLEVFARAGYYVMNGTNPYTYLQPIEGITFAPYANMTSVGYPPLWPLMCGFLYYVYNGISWLTSISSPYIYYFLLKQPAIFGDIVSAVITSRLVGKTASKSVLIFWLFNPLMIILSAVWGMFDSMAVMLSLASLSYFIKGRSAASGSFIGLGAVLKLIPVIYMPILLLYSKSRIKFAALFTIIVSLIILAPFLLLGWSPIGFLFSMASQAVNIREAPAVGGLTIFSLFEPIFMIFPERVPPIILTGLSFLWVPALGAFYLKLYWPVLKGLPGTLLHRNANGSAKKVSLRGILRLLIISNLIFLLTRPWISEGTVLYLISLMLIDIVLFHREREKLFTAIWVLALMFLIANNTLLLRFASPITDAVVQVDLAINNGPITGPIRMVIRLALSVSFYIASILALQAYARPSKPNLQNPPDLSLNLSPGPKKVTVGICAHNEQENIGRLLDSLKAQKLEGDFSLQEIIVVSSGSTDDTNAIVSKKAQSFRKIKLVTEPERTGKSNAQNLILQRAKGGILVLVSADSVLRNRALEKLLNSFEGNVGGVIARAVPLNENRGIVNFASRFIWELLNQTNLHLDSIGKLNSLGSDMLALRAGIVDAIPEYIVNDDAYLGTVVREKGFRIAYAKDSILYIRGPSTVSDFFKQRSRVLYGHQQINSLYGVKPNIFENLMLTQPFEAMKIFILTCSRFGLGIYRLPFVLTLEAVSQIIYRTSKKQNYILWDMVNTSKREIPDLPGRRDK
ncbi:MAG: glycosyltransferase [Candidatus Methanomethylicus sp.]|nr:glycosyltransferase [Candidatus Methanomethylicus sp.]